MDFFFQWKTKSTCNLVKELRGIGQYFKIFFWLNFIVHVKIDCYFTNTKRKIPKFPLKVKKLSIFVKHASNRDEANLYSCCCLKHGYSKPKCNNLYNVQLIYVSVPRTAQTSFRIFLQTRIIVDGVKFNSHDSDSAIFKRRL